MESSVPPPPAQPGLPAPDPTAPRDSRPASLGRRVLRCFAATAVLIAVGAFAFWWFVLDDSESRRALAALKDDPMLDFKPQGFSLVSRVDERQRLSLYENPEDRFADINLVLGRRGAAEPEVTGAMVATAAFARSHGYDRVEPTSPSASTPADCLDYACSPEEESRLDERHGFVGVGGGGADRRSIRIYPRGDGRYGVTVRWNPGPRFTADRLGDAELLELGLDPMASYERAAIAGESRTVRLRQRRTDTTSDEHIESETPAIERTFELLRQTDGFAAAVAADKTAKAAGWRTHRDAIRSLPNGSENLRVYETSGTKRVAGQEAQISILGVEGSRDSPGGGRLEIRLRFTRPVQR